MNISKQILYLIAKGDIKVKDGLMDSQAKILLDIAEGDENDYVTFYSNQKDISFKKSDMSVPFHRGRMNNLIKKLAGTFHKQIFGI